MAMEVVVLWELEGQLAADVVRLSLVPWHQVLRFGGRGRGGGARGRGTSGVNAATRAQLVADSRTALREARHVTAAALPISMLSPAAGMAFNARNRQVTYVKEHALTATDEIINQRKNILRVLDKRN